VVQLYASLNDGGTWMWGPGGGTSPTLLNSSFKSDSTLFIKDGRLYGSASPKSMLLTGGPSTDALNITRWADANLPSLAAAPDGSAIFLCDASSIFKLIPDSTLGYASQKALATGFSGVRAAPMAVHPSNGDLYVGSDSAVVVLDSTTGAQKSTACTGLQGGTVRALGFNSGGDLFVATDTSVIKVVGGSAANGNTTIATNFAAGYSCESGKTLRYGINSLTVDSTGNVYVATPGYMLSTTSVSTNSYSGPSTDATIVKLTAPSWTPTTVLSFYDGAADYAPILEYDTDYNSAWFGTTIAAVGDDIVVGYYNSSHSVFRMVGGSNSSMALVTDYFIGAGFSTANPITAAGATVYGLQNHALPLIAVCAS
jgi:hypothetical protein